MTRVYEAYRQANKESKEGRDGGIYKHSLQTIIVGIPRRTLKLGGKKSNKLSLMSDLGDDLVGNDNLEAWATARINTSSAPGPVILEWSSLSSLD